MSPIVMGLDPGPEESALVRWDGVQLLKMMIAPNADVLDHVTHSVLPMPELLAIEKIQSYGMAVGASTFETVYWSGRFAQAYGPANVIRIPRIDVKMHLCHDSRAKDANIRQALIDRFGAPGTKKQPGALFGVSSHLWAALAVAVTAWDKARQSEAA